MKFYSSILALCAFLPATGAFVVQGPQTKPLASPLYTYAGTNAGVGQVARGVSGGMQRTSPRSGDVERARDIWESTQPVIVQGSSLRTWSFNNPNVERVQVLMRTEGRPLHANIDLWNGPDNTPQKMAVYIEDGSRRPFCAYVETPRGPNAVAIYNTGQLEFPLAANVVADPSREPLAAVRLEQSRTIQGGALHTYPFDPSVQSVAVLLKTDGRPLNARIELLQGPNNNKQVMEVYTEDGLERPFYVIIETPGSGNVIRIVNTATMEFPLTAQLEPLVVDTSGEWSGYSNGMSYY